MRNIVSAAALALLLGTGFAAAQTSTTPAPSTGTESNPIGAEIRGMFFTDTTMATMKSDDEMKAAFDALPADQQKILKDNCMTPTEENKPLCEKITPFYTAK
jgi:hypothetical protein